MLHKDFTKSFEDLYNITAMEEANLTLQEDLITISKRVEIKHK